tara:strand:- start:2009 stop:2434 length:426 start_codon:yes stop_codon:yes gene_type:complete
MELGFVACCGPKQSQATQARELYQSDLFKKSADYADLNFDAWLILSAEHGLINLQNEILPYDKTLTGKDPKWSDMVLGQFLKFCATELSTDEWEELELTFLTGKKYQQEILDVLKSKHPVNTPLMGKGIGEMKQWFKNQIN